MQSVPLFMSDLSTTFWGYQNYYTIYFAGGDDRFIASTTYVGDDLIYGQEGDDNIQAGLGNDIIYGGTGDDRLFGGAGHDYIYGGTGLNSLYGGDGNDRIFGGGNRDVIAAGAGDDRIFSAGGNDLIYTGDGQNMVKAGNGKDVIYGGNGIDRLYGDAGDDRIFGRDGVDTLFGGNDNDLLNGGNGNDVLHGGNGLDILQGDAGRDRLFGGNGDDRLFGGFSYDVLYGGQGDDELYGGIGSDFLSADGGNDDLYGGPRFDQYGYNSRDTFGVISGNATIHDFDSGDRLIFEDIELEEYFLAEDGVHLTNSRGHILAEITQTEDGLVISSDNASVLVMGVTADEFDFYDSSDVLTFTGTEGRDNFTLDGIIGEPRHIVITDFNAEDSITYSAGGYLLYDDYVSVYSVDQATGHLFHVERWSFGFSEIEYEFDLGDINVIDGDTVIYFDEYTILLEDYSGDVSFNLL